MSSEEELINEFTIENIGECYKFCGEPYEDYEIVATLYF